MQAKKSERHLAAIEWAKAGIPVFPCLVGDKLPACANGFYGATTDLGQIDAWWGQADYNLALSPQAAGWGVIDIEADGEADWARETAALDLPETYEVRTPRGGRHLYFAGEVHPSVRKLFKGAAIDTRGIGSYILLPPSIVNGKPYEVLHERDIAPLPAWIPDRLRAATEQHATAYDEADDPGNIARARTLLTGYVSAKDVAIEGQGGNNRTYQVACEVLNLGCSPHTAHALIEEIWNPHCIPPWPSDELATVIGNASTYAQNEAGAWASAPAKETFGTALDKLIAESKSEPERRSRFYFEDETEMEQGEEPRWIIPQLIPERASVLMYGPTQSYKSFIALDMLLGVSTNTETCGSLPEITGPCFYGAIEGRWDVKRARRQAWKIARDVSEAPDFYVGTAPIIAVPGEAQEFGEQIVARCAGRSPRLVVLDTAAKVMAGLNENDAKDASRLMQFCDSLVENLGCTVIAIGHTGKDGERGVRGSSALHAGFDTVIEIKAHRETKAVAMQVLKHKNAPEPDKPWTFEGRVVGPSLVFFPTDLSAHKMLTQSNDTFNAKRVGAALQKLNAYGEEQAVTSTVLASTILEPDENQSADEHQETVARGARTLGQLARGKLEAYAVRQGRELRWFLPAPERA